MRVSSSELLPSNQTDVTVTGTGDSAPASHMRECTVHVRVLEHDVLDLKVGRGGSGEDLK